MRPIYFGGILDSGIDLNKKLLSTKIDNTNTYPNLVTVRKLFSSSAAVADKNLKSKAEVYLLDYLQDKMQGGNIAYNWDEKIELNLDDVLSLFIPILTDGLLLETYYVDKIDDMNGNQIYLHKDDGKVRLLKSDIAFKVKSLFCDMEEIEISKSNRYAEPGNCSYYQQNEDKLFYLRFTGNVAFFAIISGVNLQKEDHLITIMDGIASSSLDLVDKMQLSDFLIPDEINAQQINKNTGSRYNYTDNYVWEFF